MAVSEAQIGYGTLLQRETAASSGVYVTVAEVRSIDGLPSYEVDDVEVTHMESPDGVREYIAGLKTPGELSFSINFLPDNASHDLVSGLMALQVAGTKLNWRVNFVGFGETFQFLGYVKTFQPTAPVDDAITASVVVKQAGAISQL